MSRSGRRFGPYLLDELLGRGGMGEVYRATDTRKDRVVALKRLSARLADDSRFVERFRREARVTAGLSDPHVIPIHDYGTIDGDLFLDMRLVEGVDLAAELARTGPFPPDRAVDVVGQVAGALDAAHHAGLVHRDVKPSNVLLARPAHARGDGAPDFAYLIDFGIAADAEDSRITSTGQVVGTIAYMAPERFASDRPGDHRVDVYALGCLLLELLVGRPPFLGDRIQVMAAHLDSAPPRPSALREGLPRGLDDVVLGSLAKDPADRQPSAGELAAAARAALSAGWSSPGRSSTDARRSESKRTTAPAAPTPTPRRPPRLPARVRLPAGAAPEGRVRARRIDVDRCRLLALPGRREDILLTVADQASEIEEWDLGTGKVHWSRKRASGEITALVVSGTLAATASASTGGRYEVTLFDVSLGGLKHMVIGEHRGPITGLAFGSTRHRLATTSEDGSLTVWSPGNEGGRGSPGWNFWEPTPRKRFRLARRGRLRDPRAIAFGVRDRYVAVADHGVTIYDTTYPWKPGQTLFSAGADAVRGLSSTGCHLAVAGPGENVSVWNLERGVEVMRVVQDSPVLAVAITVNPTRVVAGCADGSATLWDVASGECTATHRGAGAVSAVAIRREVEGGLWAAASGDGVWASPL